MRRLTGPERREAFRLRWYETALGIVGGVIAYLNLRGHLANGVYRPEVLPNPHFRLEIGLAAVLLYSSFYFYRHGHRKNSIAFTLLAVSLAFWAMLMAVGQFHSSILETFGVAGHHNGVTKVLTNGYIYYDSGQLRDFGPEETKAIDSFWNEGSICVSIAA